MTLDVIVAKLAVLAERLQMVRKASSLGRLSATRSNGSPSTV